MTREIKFRVWCGRYGGFDYFDLANSLINKDDKRPIMQYTGLKDKNGKEVYEGDIMKWENDGGTYEVAYGYGKEEYIIGTFYLKGTEMFLHNNDMEIIGNIYENPELLNNKD